MDTEIAVIKSGKYFNSLDQELVDCELCRAQKTTALGTKRCDRCYELESRIRADLNLAKRIIARLEGRSL